MSCSKNNVLGGNRLTRRVVNAVLQSTTPNVEFKPESDEESDYGSSIANSINTDVAVNALTTDTEAMYTLDVVAGDVVTGFSSKASPAGSEFLIQADRFAIYNGTTGVSPFVVDPEGIAMNTNVKIDGDLLVTGTVTTSSLAADSISDVGTLSNGQSMSVPTGMKLSVILSCTVILPNISASGASDGTSGFHDVTFRAPFAQDGILSRSRVGINIGGTAYFQEILFSAVRTFYGGQTVSICTSAPYNGATTIASGIYILLKR